MASKWRKVNVGNVVDIISGGTPKTDIKEYWGGAIPWLSVTDFNTGYRWVNAAEKSITEKGLSESATTILNQGDIIISARGTVGVIAQLAKPMAFNQSCYGIRGKSGIAETNFIYYALRHAVANMKQVAHGGVFDTIIKDTFNIININLPPLTEQRAIAHILGTLDDKIELNRRMNKTLEEMARAIFKSWFVDFDPVHAKAAVRREHPKWTDEQVSRAACPKLKPSIAALFPDSFEDSELGPIPKGWRVEVLANRVDCIKGRSYKSDELQPSKIALVTLKSFAREGGYQTDGLKPFTGSFNPEQIIEPGEVVISCTDVTQAAEVIGRTVIVRQSAEYQYLVASLDTMILRPRDETITRMFLHQIGTSKAFISHTYAHSTGTTVLHLSKNAIPTYQFVLPPKTLIQQFDDLTAIMFKQSETLEHESVTLSFLRDALLPKLISGELPIPNAERIVRRCT